MADFAQKYVRNKGRSTERFVALPYIVLASAAWKDLSPAAALIYIELKRRYNGSNNGEITLSCREAGAIGHCGKGTASKKLIELIEHGFIKAASKGLFRNRHASTWILTCNRLGTEPPSNEWKVFSKIKTSVLVEKLHVPKAKL